MQYLLDSYCIVCGSHFVVLFIFILAACVLVFHRLQAKRRNVQIFHYTQNQFFCVKIIKQINKSVFCFFLSIIVSICFLFSLIYQPIVWKHPFFVYHESSCIITYFISVVTFPLLKSH